MVIIGGLCLFILVDDFNNNNQEEYITTNNLTYAFYNHSTKEINYLDSEIPIYIKSK